MVPEHAVLVCKPEANLRKSAEGRSRKCNYCTINGLEKRTVLVLEFAVSKPRFDAFRRRFLSIERA